MPKLAFALTLLCWAGPALAERHVGSDTQMAGAPVVCLRWPYPSRCLIAGVRWHPTKQQVEQMRGGSWEGMCWMWLDVSACAHMDKQ
jgi:hypothetical protein